MNLSSSGLPYFSTLILAGGAARRMGGQDKGLVCLKGRPLVSWVRDAIPKACAEIIISCNRNQKQYAEYADLTVGDKICEGVEPNEADNTDRKQPRYQGPLAGIAAGLNSAKHSHVLVLPCDNPNINVSILQDFVNQVSWERERVNVVAIKGQIEPLYLFLHRSRLASLEQALIEEQYKVQAWLKKQSMQVFDATPFSDFFTNINYLEELEVSQR